MCISPVNKMIIVVIFIVTLVLLDGCYASKPNSGADRTTSFNNDEQLKESSEETSGEQFIIYPGGPHFSV